MWEAAQLTGAAAGRAASDAASRSLLGQARELRDSSSNLALVFVLVGAVALFNLPVAQYPNVAPPSNSDTANNAGASAET